MTILIWAAFIVFLLAMVTLDLGVFHRERRAITLPEALGWTAFWIALALAFNAVVLWLYAETGPEWFASQAQDLTGREAALQFFTGYLLEKSLSVDNIFVIAMVFAYFRVPLSEQHRVLFWGILGAVVLRGVMIAAGATLIHRFEWVIYLFGVLVLLSAAKMLAMRHDNIDPERNLAIRFVRRFYPVTDGFEGGRFFVRVDGRRAATPLFLALVLVETSDVMFALDSIPAIFAVTRDPFLVFTSNVFAILGLRSLYFALAGLMDRFRYLKLSLVFILAYVGVKMILSHAYPIPNLVSLVIIAAMLFVGISASVVLAGRDTAALHSPLQTSEFPALSPRTPAQGRRAAALLIGSAVLVGGIAIWVAPGWNAVTIPAAVVLVGLALVGAWRWIRAGTAGPRSSDRTPRGPGPNAPPTGGRG